MAGLRSSHRPSGLASRTSRPAHQPGNYRHPRAGRVPDPGDMTEHHRVNLLAAAVQGHDISVRIWNGGLIPYTTVAARQRCSQVEDALPR